MHLDPRHVAAMLASSLTVHLEKMGPEFENSVFFFGKRMSAHNCLVVSRDVGIFAHCSLKCQGDFVLEGRTKVRRVIEGEPQALEVVFEDVSQEGAPSANLKRPPVLRYRCVPGVGKCTTPLVCLGTVLHSVMLKHTRAFYACRAG